jgi:hypothetical protein
VSPYRAPSPPPLERQSVGARKRRGGCGWQFTVLGVAIGVAGSGACFSREVKEAAADSSYLAEHMRCVDRYPTRPEIEACREGVRIRWGVPADGGSHE